MALVCVSTYIRSKDLSLPHLFAFPRPFIPIIYSYSPFRINHARTIIPSRFLTHCHVIFALDVRFSLTSS